MSKLLLVSVLLATVVIPVQAARAPDPVRGLRTLVWRASLFMAGYVLALRFIYPRLL